MEVAGKGGKLWRCSLEFYVTRFLFCMRIVNAIPNVCKAAPGILNIDDFPMSLPCNAFRSDAVHIDHKICSPKA